jgi:hypothetical protein
MLHTVVSAIDLLTTDSIGRSDRDSLFGSPIVGRVQMVVHIVRWDVHWILVVFFPTFNVIIIGRSFYFPFSTERLTLVVLTSLLVSLILPLSPKHTNKENKEETPTKQGTIVSNKSWCLERSRSCKMIYFV